MIVLATVLVCSVAVAAVPASPQRIVGGTTTSVSNYPSIAALLYSTSQIFYRQACGGTIVNKEYILTAAHCVNGDPTQRWRIRVGSSFANSGGSVFNLRSIFIHPLYNSAFMDYDLSILRTITMISYSSLIQPATLVEADFILEDDQLVWAAGWGTTSAGGLPSEQLRHVQLKTVNQTICNSRYTGLGINITDNMLCSGWLNVGGRDQCQGDSGGPLYHANNLVGVCSFGIGCATSMYPGVNTRVSRFIGWIMSITN